MTTALLIIDVQNDYFPGGRFPLWNTASTLDAIEAAIGRARARDLPVIHVQHVATDAQAGFFRPGTGGVDIHPRVLAAAPGAPVVVKQHADAFHRTTLDEVLQAHGVEHLLVGGMMTQNCVTHTVLSRAADRYRATVLADCTTTVSEPIHQFALHALTTRMAVAPGTQVL